jgi:hypothetical protein
MVMARVAVKCDTGTSSSPGIAAPTSDRFAPHRRCQCRHNGAVTNNGKATTTSATCRRTAALPSAISPAPAAAYTTCSALN